MAANIKIDTSQFNAMIRELSAKAAVPSDEVLVFEIGKVLEKTLSYTPAAEVSKIRFRFDNAEFSVQPRSLYNPKTSRSAAGSRVAYYLRNRYPNALWNALSARRKKSLQARLAARGLSKQSWLQLAEQMGISIRVPGYVRKARPTSGQTYTNTSARTTRARGKLQVQIENAQPTVNLPAVGGARALQRAIDGRVKFFARNVGLGVFNDVAQIAKRYKGMRVK